MNGADLPIAVWTRRAFAICDAIDAAIDARHGRRLHGRPKYPARGSVPCPNCDGRVSFVQLTPTHGAARCSGTCGIEFAPLRPITEAEIQAANRRLES